MQRNKLNQDGRRTVSDFFSGQFVHDVYEELDDGDVLILLIVCSDKTHQDVLGIHEAYPVYLYLGNVETKVRTKNGNAGIVIGKLRLLWCFFLVAKLHSL